MESANPLISPQKEPSLDPTEKSNQEIKEENNREITKLHDEYTSRFEKNPLEESSGPQNQANLDEKEIEALHGALEKRLGSWSEDSEDEHGNNQGQKEEEEFKYEDLDNIPDTTLIQKYKRMWNQLAMGPITKSAQTKLLTQLAKIDEKLQTIEKRELDKHFGGAYETYNYILRRFYEKLLNEKAKELKRLGTNHHQVQEELQKLEDELEKAEKQSEELRNKHTEELKNIEEELDKYKNNVSERNKANAELLKSIEGLYRDSENLTKQRVELEQKLKEKEEELSKASLSLQDAEIEKKKIEGRYAMTLEKYEDLRNKDGDLETRNKQLGEAINQLQSSREILQTYEEREKNLKVELEESKKGIDGKKNELETLKEKHKNEMEKLNATIKKLEEDNVKLKQTEDALNKHIQKQEEDFKAKNKDIEDKRTKIEIMKKLIEEETEKLEAQRERLDKRQEELDKLRAIDRGLEVHKQEVRKLIEENNFKREQVLKAIQDLATKGERFEEDKKSFEAKVQEQTNLLKSKRDITKRVDPSAKEYDTLPVCLGFLGGMILALIGCWFAFGLVGRGVVTVN